MKRKSNLRKEIKMENNQDKRLPRTTDLKPLKCVKITMSNEKEYIVTQEDIIAVQFVRPMDNKIIIRRGRVQDLVIINQRELSTPKDNASRIILDCSEQFSVKVIEIKFKDIIAIGGIDTEFEDYSDRIEELGPNFMEGNTIPIRHGGMCTSDECCKPAGITTRGVAIRK
jgi:hypothetical protein